MKITKLPELANMRPLWYQTKEQRRGDVIARVVVLVCMIAIGVMLAWRG